jgi:hypothetical protein
MNRHTLLSVFAASMALAVALPALGASAPGQDRRCRPAGPRDTPRKVVAIEPDDPGPICSRAAEVERMIDEAAEKAFTSVLFDAVKAGNAARVRALVELDAGVVNARDGAGRTPLHWAARNASVPVLTLLIEKGADVNAVDRSGMAALHSLASNGNVEGLSLLLDRGADPEVATPEGKTPLQLAARAGRVEAVRLLSRRNGDLAAPRVSGVRS